MWLPVILILLILAIFVAKNKDRILLRIVQKNPTAKLSLLANIASGNADKMYQELITGLSKAHSQFVNSYELKTPVLFEMYVFLVHKTITVIKKSSDKSLETVKDFLVYKASDIFNDDFENRDLNNLVISRIDGYSKVENELKLLSEYISIELGRQYPIELEEKVEETQTSVIIKEVIEMCCTHRIEIYTDGLESVFSDKNEFSKLTITEIANLFKEAIEKKAGSV